MSAPSAPAFLANRVSRMASRVLLDPVPGTTLIRPRACSTTAAMTRSCSSWSSVGDSPVVPTGDRQSVPCSTCQSTSWRKAGKSISPLRNGVTSARVTPANCSPFVEIIASAPGAGLHREGTDIFFTKGLKKGKWRANKEEGPSQAGVRQKVKGKNSKRWPLRFTYCLLLRSGDMLEHL